MKSIDLNSLSSLLDQGRTRALQGRLQSQKAPQGSRLGDSEMRQVCRDFEAMFIQKMWQAMRSTLPKEGLFHSRMQEKYLNMFDQAFAESMSRQGGIGLSEMLMRELQDRLEGVTRETSSGTGGAENAERGDPEDARAGEKPSLAAGEEPPASPASLDAMDQSEAYRRMEDLARRIEELDGPAGREETAGLGGPNVPYGPPADAVGGPLGKTGAPYGELVEPVDGELTSDFGWRPDPFTGEKAWHSGIDLSAPTGTAVKACWPGEVISSEDRGGYGRVVVLEHQNGWQSIYAHNRRNRVEVGQRVGAGQVIAEVGQSGRTTGPHLHFELRQGDVAWNPKQIERRLLAGLAIGRAA